MTLSDAARLSVAELILYAPVFPLTLYLGWRHGRHGILGYFYLSACCAVRMASDIISLLPANQDSATPTLSSAILSSIGLTPLILALAGFLHEAHLHLVTGSATDVNSTRVKKIKRWLNFLQVNIHSVAVIAMVLLIIGAIHLVSPSKPLTESDLNTDYTLRSTGAVIILVLWFFMVQYSLYLRYRVQQTLSGSRSNNAIAQLVNLTALALPFVGLRCVYTVVYCFKHNDSTLNPITGALWVKVIFMVLAPYAAVLMMCLGGWGSRDMRRDSKSLAQKVGPDGLMYEGIHITPKMEYSASA